MCSHAKSRPRPRSSQKHALALLQPGKGREGGEGGREAGRDV
jgi:hypothetical protein